MKNKQRILLHVLFFVVFFILMAALAVDVDDPQELQEHHLHTRKKRQIWLMYDDDAGAASIPAPDSPKDSCVPPGTGQETRHLCPCYDKMVNPKTGKPKCP
ncbi:gibberellin-regulated protein 2-like [Panicum miliaceum]|uniref:Gibberellin-regulated protein 2-like n=1 Tax=Panicum miliaceum TaxID=4540 RepID=A0A3L6RYU0_PANMI|nr:gibberellin-regulated protein 2-like [Panicum miliaceum]